MNKPEHTRPFNLEHARAGAPFSIANGEEVEVLKWDRKHAQCIVTVSRQDAAIRSYCADGTASHIDPKFHLVMTPLGYIDGKPVFVGDEIGHREAPDDITVLALPHDRDFADCRWPAPKPVFPETRMSFQELCEAGDMSLTATSSKIKDVANAALRHAIEAGQVVAIDDRKLTAKELGDAERLLAAMGYRRGADGKWCDRIGIAQYVKIIDDCGVIYGDEQAVERVRTMIDARAARDMAIAKAVINAVVEWANGYGNVAVKAGFVAGQLRGFDLAAIIATVQEGR